MDIEKIRGEIPTMDTEAFKKLRASLSREQLQALRPEIESRRGIQRDENGHIIRSNEWREQRIKFLEDKITDFQQRIKNSKVEIKNLQKELSDK